jgi:hypothetical protein
VSEEAEHDRQRGEAAENEADPGQQPDAPSLDVGLAYGH